MASYFNYKIQEFLVEVSEGKFIDLTQTVAAIEYVENILSPVVYTNLVLLNTSGIISNLKLRGGERVRLKISQDATGNNILSDLAILVASSSISDALSLSLTNKFSVSTNAKLVVPS